MKTIEIKDMSGKVIFAHKEVDNTIKKTVVKAVENNVDLIDANLMRVNLKGANLEGGVFSGANFMDSNLSNVNFKDTYLVKANLSISLIDGSDISDSYLRNADLSGSRLKGTNLSRSDLMGANLACSIMTGSNISGANLRNANIRETVLDERIVSVSGIGSEKRRTIYSFDQDKVWCGCFTGTLEDFEIKVRLAHANNPKYLKEYLGVINYFKSLRPIS